MNDVNFNVQMPFFPVPAPGETIFSVVGRCIERLGIANQHLLPLLTGQRLSTSLFSALPGYLWKISSAMPDGHPWRDIQTLINSHTALAYFTYFHTEDQQASTRQLLASAGNTHPITLSLGLSRYRVPVQASSVKFCISCLHEQYCSLGHSYFHLAHQLPGVTHCREHGKLLAHGCLNCGTYPLRGKKLTMPGQCLCKTFNPLLLGADSSNPDSALWLARESAYLLNSTAPSFNRRERLREGIFHAGLCRGSLVDYDLVANAVNERFGTEFLVSINHPTRDKNGRPSAWIRRSLPSDPIDKRLSTIIGLLILGTTFDSVNAFENKQFSERSQIASSTAPPVLDTTTSPIWAPNLSELLAANNYRISTCAARLNVSSSTVAIEARQQNLTIPLTPAAVTRIGMDRLTNIRTQLKNGVEKDEILRTEKISAWTLQLIELDDPRLPEQHRSATAERRRENHRRRVLEYLNEHPMATRQTISSALAGAYDFLISHDNDWFWENVPKAERIASVQRFPRNDWEAIDESLSEAIQATGMQMLAGDDRPVRITRSMLLGQHQALQKYHNDPNRLPITSRMLDKLVETSEQFIQRKVTWGIQRLVASKKEITMDALRRETAISDVRLKQRLKMIQRIVEELGASISEKSVLGKDAGEQIES